MMSQCGSCSDAGCTGACRKPGEGRSLTLGEAEAFSRGAEAMRRLVIRDALDLPGCSWLQKRVERLELPRPVGEARASSHRDLEPFPRRDDLTGLGYRGG